MESSLGSKTIGAVPSFGAALFLIAICMVVLLSLVEIGYILHLYII
jgi:hypothetical protein